MADERKYFVLCSNNCKFEGMTKEQILTAIEQAINDGEIKDVNSGFITTIKEQNANYGLKFWVGTTAQYNAIAEKRDDTLYLLSDETTEEDINKIFAETSKAAQSAEEKATTALAKAVKSENQFNKYNKIILEDKANIDGNYLRYTAGQYPFGDYNGFLIVMSNSTTEALSRNNSEAFFAYAFEDYEGAKVLSGGLVFGNATVYINIRIVLNRNGYDYLFPQFGVGGNDETAIAKAGEFKYLRQIIGVL